MALDPAVAPILQNLARGIFPLTDWLKQRPAGGYVPPADVPWRQSGEPRLSIDDLKVIDFFENLLAADNDTALAKRWNDLIAKPPKFGRADPTGWRASRGLNPGTKFGILDSDNFILFPFQTKTAMTRVQFYEAVWPPLKDIVITVKPQSPQDWSKLIDLLRTDDASIKWPLRPTPSASEFIRQFTNDCLYALLSFPKSLEPPWNAAVPIEVGEFRRPGQKVSANQAEKAVQDFVAKT